MKRVLVLIIVTAIVASCSSGSKKQAQHLYYRWSPATSWNQPVVIEVKRPKAMGVLGNRPMVVQKEDGSLVQMNNHFWLESPKVLLWHHLQQAFASGNSGGDSTFIVDSEIRRLEKFKNQAFVSIHFQIRSSSGDILIDKTIEKSLSSEDSSINAFVKNIRSAVSEIVIDLQTEITHEVQ